jgi:WD40 repeat protein
MGGGFVFDAVFPTDDRHVLMAELDAEKKVAVIWVRRWDVETGKDEVLCAIKEVNCWSGRINTNTQLLAPDGSKVLVQELDKRSSLPLWELNGCRKAGHGTITVTTGDGSGSGVLALTADGWRCYFGALDGTVGFCDLRAGKGEMKTFLRYHQSPVQALALAPDGATLATADANGLVILWNVAAGKKWFQWKAPGKVSGLAFAPDDRHFATANDNGTVYILRLAERK